MEFTGKVISINKDWESGKFNITFTVNEEGEIRHVDNIKDCEKLRIKAVKYRNKRSIDANAYMWIILSKIADAVNTDKWDVYLDMLSKYGVFTHMVVKPNVVERVKEEWRATKELGPVKVNGKEGVQLQCYFGSSTYNTKEMATLIDGVVSEAKDLGIETLPPDELERMKKEWGK